jgi:hypothetical protein
MRWTHLLAAFLFACSTTAALAEMPDFSNSRQPQQLLQGGRLFGGQGWWSRYGEPVNSAAMSQPEASPSDKEAPLGPMPAYGDGYVYGPGTCDCPPPCVSHLWAGYFQNPKRCHPHHMRNRRCNACDDGCNACAKGGCGMLARMFSHSSCNSCTTAAPDCTTPVTCTTAAADCGCKPVCGKCRSCHLGGRWRGFGAHWCGASDSCSAPVSCGCTTPTAPMQTFGGSEKQVQQGLPVPQPEEPVLYSLPRLN